MAVPKVSEQCDVIADEIRDHLLRWWAKAPNRLDAEAIAETRMLVDLAAYMRREAAALRVKGL